MVALAQAKVLVVDDSRQIRQLVANVLTGLVAEMRETEDGEAALFLWREWKPDVILVDYEMPRLSGVMFTRVIRDLETPRRRRTPILMMTGHADEKHVRFAKEAGVDGFVAKPLSVGVLLNRLQDVLLRAA